ncbi:hypothetical protein AB0J52_05305 [Spirillospora sp. NPDC049652]
MRPPKTRIVVAGGAAGALALGGGVAYATAGSSPQAAGKVSAQTPAGPDVVSKDFGSGVSAQANLDLAKMKLKPMPMPAGQAGGMGADAADTRSLSLDGSLPENSPDALKARSAVTAASSGAKVWTRHGKAPARTIGRLIASDDGMTGYYCTATVVTSHNKSTVWTAGHCVHKGRGGAGGFFRYYAFQPDYDRGKGLGTWYLNAVRVMAPWAYNRDLRYDFAAFTVRKHGTTALQSVTGAQGVSFGYKHRKYPFRTFGYPALLLPSGKKVPSPLARLYYCSGTSFASKYPTGGLGIMCSMGNGASGGPWLYGMKSNGIGRVAGVNSTHMTRTLQMNSPYLGSAAIKLYKATQG